MALGVVATAVHRFYEIPLFSGRSLLVMAALGAVGIAIHF
jgi:hypothetical protein